MHSEYTNRDIDFCFIGLGGHGRTNGHTSQNTQDYLQHLHKFWNFNSPKIVNYPNSYFGRELKYRIKGIRIPLQGEHDKRNGEI